MLNGRATALVHARTKVSISSTVLRTPAERELVAGEPGEEIAGLEHAGESLCDLDEQLVAGVVTEGVVHLFEAVEVEHDDERGRVRARAPVRGCPSRSRSNAARLARPVRRSWCASNSRWRCIRPRPTAAAELVGERSEATEVGVGERLECTLSSAHDEYSDDALVGQHGRRAHVIDRTAAGMSRHRRRAGPRAIVGRRCGPGARRAVCRPRWSSARPRRRR